jgi:hypothetical protein
MKRYMYALMCCCGLVFVALPLCSAESLNDQMEAAVDLPSDMPESEYRMLQERKAQLDQERELLDGEIKLFNIDCGSVPASDAQKIRVCRAKQLMLKARIDNYKASLSSFRMAIRAAQLKPHTSPHLDSSVVDLRDKKSDVVDMGRVKGVPMGLQWKQAAPQQPPAGRVIQIPVGVPGQPPAAAQAPAAKQPAVVPHPPLPKTGLRAVMGEEAVRKVVLKELLKNPLADAGVAVRDRIAEGELAKMIIEEPEVSNAFNDIVEFQAVKKKYTKEDQDKIDAALKAAIADFKKAHPTAARQTDDILQLRVVDDPQVSDAIQKAWAGDGVRSHVDDTLQKKFWNAVKRVQEKRRTKTGPP